MSKTDKARSTHPVMQASEPCLFTVNFDAAIAFYADKLGFEVVFTYGEPAFFGQIRRDAALLNLRHVDGSPFHDDARERDELLSATINVGNAADIRALFEEFQSAGVGFHRPLKQEPWGARTFVVRDPDGNLLLFAGTAASSRPWLTSSTSAIRRPTPIRSPNSRGYAPKIRCIGRRR